MANKKNRVSKNPGGRPFIDFDLDIAIRICDIVSTQAIGLNRTLAQSPDFPKKDTFYRWRRDYPEVDKMYKIAKMHQADIFVDEILEIAYNSEHDYIEDKNGNTVFNTEHFNRSRLKIDSIKWIAAKLIPKVYGDKAKDDTSQDDKTEAKLDIEARTKKYKELEKPY